MQNFGIINETFKDILVEEIGKKGGKGKAMFNKYMKALKSNKTLRTQYHVYNQIEKKIETDKIKSLEYIKESILILKKIGIKNIIAENKTLIKFLTKNGYNLTDENYQYKELHENIGNMATTKKTAKNLDSILESAYFISDYINNNKEIIKENVSGEFYSNVAVGTIMVDKYNTKYYDINESDREIIKTIISGGDDSKEKLFNDTLRECIDLVNAKLTESTIDEKDKLLQVKDKLLRMDYDNETFLSEINKITNLKTNLL